MVPQRTVLSNVAYCTYIHVDMDASFMKRQNENSPENISWCEIGKQNIQAKQVYYNEKPL